jgi:hypothetical protein
MTSAAAYDSELLAVLGYEFSQSDVAVSERKIRRRLREKGLGAYDQARVDAARALKNDVQQVFDHRTSSPFHKPGADKHAAESDWNLPGLVAHLQARHSTLNPESVHGFVRWGLFYYYLK